MSRGSARRRVLLSRETLIGLVVVVLAAAICVGLGLWQFGRFEGKRDAAAVVETNFSAEPVALEDALENPDQQLPADEEWTPVTLHGSYCTDPGCELYVRNRSLGGSVGFWQLVPFHADDGTEMLVVRGWVNSAGDESVPAKTPPIPAEDLTITVRLHPAEEVLDRENPPGQVHSVNPRDVADELPDSDETLVTGAYGELAAEEPEAPRPTPLEDPDTSLGPHLSYAFQWWIFALFFPAALFFRTRKMIREAAEDEETEQTPARTAGVRRPRARSRDEEEEDALIDQQGE